MEGPPQGAGHTVGAQQMLPPVRPLQCPCPSWAVGAWEGVCAGESVSGLQPAPSGSPERRGGWTGGWAVKGTVTKSGLGRGAVRLPGPVSMDT